MPRTKVKTGVKTGTLVAVTFLAASAAFAAFAMPKTNLRMRRAPIALPVNVTMPDLSFKDGRAAFLANDPTTLQLDTLYYNTGTATARGHNNAYFFTDTNQGNAIPIAASILGLGVVGPMDANTAKTISKRVSSVPISAVYIAVVLDYSNEVSETSETNNLLFIPIGNRPAPSKQVVQVPVVSLPDLMVVASRAEMRPITQNPVTLGVFLSTTIKNIGTQNVGANDYQMELQYLAANNVPVGEAGHSGTMVHLDPGQEYSVDFAGPSLQYLRQNQVVAVKIVVDYANTVRESREDNNTLTIPIQLPPVASVAPIVTLSAASPSGTGIPGLNEVLRFTILNPNPTDIGWGTVTFGVNSTDHARTSWNTGLMGTVAAWSLYDASDRGTRITPAENIQLYSSRGTLLTSADVVRYARFSLPGNTIIPANASRTFILKVDTTGASASQDDSVRFDIQEENSAPPDSSLWGIREFQWADLANNQVGLDGTGVRGLPITGGAIIY